MHQLGVGLQAVTGPAASVRLGIVLERRVRRGDAEESRKQVVELGRRHGAAPEPCTALACLPEHVDEKARLAVLVDARRSGERETDVGADIGEHAPDHRVRDLVETAEAEERERLEQRYVEWSVLEQADRQPTRARQRGK